MSRVAIPIDYLEDVPAPDVPVPGGHIGGSLEGLLLMELRSIERQARLTPWQAVVLELNINGVDDEEIAAAFQRNVSSVRQARESAQLKLQQVKHKGLLTVMVEELGWISVKELLIDRQEAALELQRQKHDSSPQRSSRKAA